MTADADRAAREVLAAAEKATPGPWHVVGPPWNHGTPWINTEQDPHTGVFICDLDPEPGDLANFGDPGANAAFIALARTAAPLLAAEVLRLRALVDDAATLVQHEAKRVVAAEAEVLRLRETLEAVLAARDALDWDEVAVAGEDRTVGVEEADEVAAIYEQIDALRSAIESARAALASSPGHDVARYTAEPSARGDTAPEEPR